MRKTEALNLSGDEYKERLQEIFSQAVGVDNAITKKEIFNKMFGNSNKYSDLELVDLSRKITYYIGRLRKRSYCFVISRQTEHYDRVYYAIKDKSDLEYYKGKTKKLIRGLNALARRAEKAVEKKYYQRIGEEMPEEKWLV